MGDLLKRLYSIYGTIVFFGTFFLLFPIFFLTIQVSGWRKYGRMLNRLWSKIFFSMLLIRVKFENLDMIKEHRQYVVVSNHFSYLDIPVLGLIPYDLVFVGKSSLGNVPLFGYMFRNLHISVDRNSLKSRGASITKAKEALDEGSSVVIFPEGGINATHPPVLAKFKDGAFRIAIDKQIPVIPITLSFNHLILPDDGKFLLRFKTAKVVVHPPVEVNGLDSKAVNTLREKCHRVIQDQLLADNPTSLVNLKADPV